MIRSTCLLYALLFTATSANVIYLASCFPFEKNLSYFPYHNLSHPERIPKISLQNRKIAPKNFFNLHLRSVSLFKRKQVINLN